MEARKPIVAGQFYPLQHYACVDEINQFLDEIPPFEALPETIVAAIVPHAGWTFSGKLGVMAFAAIKQQHDKVHTFVIFGAAHTYFGRIPAMYAAGAWTTPMGDTVIDEELAKQILADELATSDTHAHSSEHSIEVQVPFIQAVFPGAKILPIVVAPTEHAVALGTGIGKIIAAGSKKIVCIGSTDLTHYGPRYGFTPMGRGPEALAWASRVNDKRFINLALKLQPERMMASAAENCNACGSGAAAAAVAAAKQLGKTSGILLAHTNSSKVMAEKMGSTSTESVGYAALIF